MDRITASGALGRGLRRRALLEYLLRAELNDEGDKIKAYSIGLDVFGKSKDFDPGSDSAVRVEVGRLRTAIALFEAGDFADTALKVDIPVGTYRPNILRRDPKSLPGILPSSSEAPPPPTSVKAEPLRAVPLAGLLAVIGLVALSAFYILLRQSDTPDFSQPISLAVEEFDASPIGQELSFLIKDSFANNRLIAITEPNAKVVSDMHFVTRGNILQSANGLQVSVELLNSSTDRVAWNHIFLIEQDKDIKDEIDAKLNGELETRLLGAVKRDLESRDPERMTPGQLFLLATWVSGPAESSLEWETERVALMLRALSLDADFGPAHSVLADKYGFLANMHPDWDTAENLELAQFHAERAIELAPQDASAMFNVAQSYWHTGRHQDSQRMFRRVTELDSSNSLARFFARVVPYWCDDVPDDVMAWAVDFDKALSGDDPVRWIVLTWIAKLHSNRGEYELGLDAVTDAAQIFQVGYTYMLHAMLLNTAERPDAAIRTVQRQFKNWPGISATHYAESTVPRLCKEQDDQQRFVAGYAGLATVLEARSATLDGVSD